MNRIDFFSESTLLMNRNDFRWIFVNGSGSFSGSLLMDRVGSEFGNSSEHVANSTSSETGCYLLGLTF